MANISAEKRMHLANRIREEHQINQQKMKSRESILYGAYPAQETEEEQLPPSTFRLRFALSAMLFMAYLALDMAGGSIFGKNAKEIYALMQENYQIAAESSKFLDFFASLADMPEETGNYSVSGQ